MTGYGNGDRRTDHLRAGFEQQGTQALAQEAAREERQKHRAHTVIGAVLAAASVVLIIYRLGSDGHFGVSTAVCAVGAALSASAGFLSRRVSPRLALVVMLLGMVVSVVSDTLAHPYVPHID